MNWTGLKPDKVEVSQHGKLIAVVRSEESAEAVIRLCLLMPPHSYSANEYLGERLLGGDSFSIGIVE